MSDQVSSIAGLVVFFGFILFAATSHDRLGPLVAIALFVLGIPAVIALLHGASGSDE